MICPYCDTKILNETSATCPSCGNNLYKSGQTSTINPIEEIHDTYAWLLALTPILLIGLTIFMAISKTDAPSTSIATILYITIMVMDRKLLKDNGINISIAWIISGAILPPLYLLIRCSKSGRSMAPAYTSVLVCGIFIIVLAVLTKFF